MIWSQEVVGEVRAFWVRSQLDKEVVYSSKDIAKAVDDFKEQTVNDYIKTVGTLYGVTINKDHLVISRTKEFTMNQIRLIVQWDPVKVDSHFPELDETMVFPGRAKPRIKPQRPDLSKEVNPWRDVWFYLDGWDDEKEHWIYKEAN